MKKLFIDQDLCDKCEKCSISCSYFYHPGNNGVYSLRELAKYAVYCRRCELGTCVQSCPQDALEKPKGDVLRRYNMRCISCKSCSIACPFGTILPELLPYMFNKCDYCLGRCDDINPPLCVKTCNCGALAFVDVEEDKTKKIYKINDKFYVKSLQWKRT